MKKIAAGACTWCCWCCCCVLCCSSVHSRCGSCSFCLSLSLAHPLLESPPPNTGFKRSAPQERNAQTVAIARPPFRRLLTNTTGLDMKAMDAAVSKGTPDTGFFESAEPREVTVPRASVPPLYITCNLSRAKTGRCGVPRNLPFCLA